MKGTCVVMVRAVDVGDHAFNVTVDWVTISGFTDFTSLT